MANRIKCAGIGKGDEVLGRGGDPNSRTALTDVPAIVNLQNTVTNPVVDAQRFYRLKQ